MAGRRGRPGPDRHRAGRQGHHVLRDHHVRRARRRDHVPGSGFSDLPLGDRVLRRQGGADPALRGERLLVLGRGGAGQDHAAHAADHHQQPGQSDRRRGPARGARQAGRRPRGAPRGRGHVGRDLRPHGLRQRPARQHAGLSRARGPADPARRLVQDLRHDRLAAGLRGLAEGRWSSTRRGLRSTSTAASTPRPSGPGSRRSRGRRTRSSGWSRRSTSAGR